MKLAMSLLINALLLVTLAFVLFVELAHYNESFYVACALVLFAGVSAIMALDEFIEWCGK
jgi:hypothetical protein